MIIMAVLFIGTGLMFLVYPQKTAGDAGRSGIAELRQDGSGRL
ncbi:hypothetical protein [Paenibacillus sp. FSL R7-0652]